MARREYQGVSTNLGLSRDSLSQLRLTRARASWRTLRVASLSDRHRVSRKQISLILACGLIAMLLGGRQTALARGPLHSRCFRVADDGPWAILEHAPARGLTYQRRKQPVVALIAEQSSLCLSRRASSAAMVHEVWPTN